MAAEPIHELSAGYALNALDPQEDRFYSRHLAHCEQCQADVTSFAATVAALGYAAPAVVLPPQLRRRVLAAVHVESARSRWRFGPPAAAAAVALCAAAAGLTVWATGSVTTPDAALVRTLPLSGATGSIARSPSGDATLTVSHLHAAPIGKTYEAWIIQDGAAVPAAVFPASIGETVVHLTKRLPHGAMVAVTIESGSGSARLTRPPIFTSASA